MKQIIILALIRPVYHLLIIFIAWLVPAEKMKNAANYIKLTENNFGTKRIRKLYTNIKNRK